MRKLHLFFMVGLFWVVCGGLWLMEGHATTGELDPGYGVVYFQNPVFARQDPLAATEEGRKDFTAWAGTVAAAAEGSGPDVREEAVAATTFQMARYDPPPWAMGPVPPYVGPWGRPPVPMGYVPPVPRHGPKAQKGGIRISFCGGPGSRVRLRVQQQRPFPPMPYGGGRFPGYPGP